VQIQKVYSVDISNLIGISILMKRLTGNNTAENHLSIFIPTFNRWEILSETLPHTLGCLPKDFIVRIINNNSKNEGRGAVEKVISEHPQIDCKIIDNSVNIGGEANFLRCVELCKTPYIFILGDDDYLKNNFIKDIDFYLEQKTQWGWIIFQVKKRYESMCIKDHTFNDPFQMTSSCNNWAELMFISSSIFSVELLKNGLYDAHQWQSTWSVLPIAAIKGWENQEQANLSETDYKFILSAREIIESTGYGDAHYSQVDVYQHLPIIERVPFNTLIRKKIIKRAVRGGVKHIFKARVLAKHFYTHVWQQSPSKSLMDYKTLCHGLEYMIGPKAYFYKPYLAVVMLTAWTAKFIKKLVKKNVV